MLHHLQPPQEVGVLQTPFGRCQFRFSAAVRSVDLSPSVEHRASKAKTSALPLHQATKMHSFAFQTEPETGSD